MKKKETAPEIVEKNYTDWKRKFIALKHEIRKQRLKEAGQNVDEAISEIRKRINKSS